MHTSTTAYVKFHDNITHLNDLEMELDQFEQSFQYGSLEVNENYLESFQNLSIE